MSGSLVVDTDCGTDDAMALVLALKHRKVWAITCCAGNTSVDNACANVLRVLHFCKSKEIIPVYRGCSVPLLQKLETIEDIHGGDGFGNCSTIYSTGSLRVQEGAAEALVRMSKAQKITIVALAPLTNLALAHRLDPNFTERVEAIYIMGGNYKGIGNITETAEFNFYCDPEAANIVLTEARCPIVLIPWETTVDYGIHWDEYESLMNIPSRIAGFLKNVTGVVAEYCRKSGDPCFLDCDFLAMAAALDPEAVKSSLKRHMVVECDGKYTRGQVVCLKNPPEGANIIEVVEHFNPKVLKDFRRDMVTD